MSDGYKVSIQVDEETYDRTRKQAALLRVARTYCKTLAEEGKQEVRMAETEEDRGFGRGVQYAANLILSKIKEGEQDGRA